VLAGSEEGNWLYLFGADAQQSDRSLEVYQQPIRKAPTAWGNAEIAEGDLEVFAMIGGKRHAYSPPGQPRISCIAAVEGELWIGHEHGIDVIGKQFDGTMLHVGSLRLDGPVKYIIPKWDAGAVYVAEFGGFGVARVEREPMDPVAAQELIKAAEKRRKSEPKEKGE
jgi:hypothetical protein